jgi:hypothetical protein
LTPGAHTTVKPDIAVSLAQAQVIVDRVVDGQTVAQVSELQGGAIGAIYEIGLMSDAPSLVLKVYPESLHWKMQKEVNVCALLSGHLSAPVPRVLLADDAKSIIGLNFVLMSKLGGVVLRVLEPTLADAELFATYSQMGEVLLHRWARCFGKFMKSRCRASVTSDLTVSGHPTRAIAPICRSSLTRN